MKTSIVSLCALALLACTVSRAKADLVMVTVTNEGNSSFALTPLWFGFDNGTFNLFDPGTLANSTSGTSALEDLAEGGDVSGLQAQFNAGAGGTQGVAAAPGGFGGAPVIEPGETAISQVVDVNKLVDRFFNFASMVIPSNDSFFGTPESVEVFDASGSFINGGNSRSFQLLGSQIWDAGTEANDTMGAAFSAVGGTATDTSENVALLPAGGLDNFLNTGTPIGNITDLIGPGEVFATVTITAVPEPSSLCLLGIAVCGLASLRRRKS